MRTRWAAILLLSACGGEDLGEMAADEETDVQEAAAAPYDWTVGTHVIGTSGNCKTTDRIVLLQRGVRYVRRVRAGSRCERPLRAFVIRANLDTDLLVRTTKQADRGTTPGAWGRSRGMIAAINANFFTQTPYRFHPVGVAMADDEIWSQTKDDAGIDIFGFGFGRAEIMATGPEPWVRWAVSGHPRSSNDGVLPSCTGTCATLEPRTAIGVSENGRFVYFAVVDGRAPSWSVGMTQIGLAGVLRRMGASDVINLDGGGSSALWIAGRGTVNRPSDGTPRIVANHVGIKRR
jgi:hypothetical protein